MNGAKRYYGRMYPRVRRERVNTFVEQSVRASGGEVLFATPEQIAPRFYAVELPAGTTCGLVVYAFEVNKRATPGRPPDEHRGQVRYGDVNRREWREQNHPLAMDPAGLDVTLVLGCQVDAGVFLGLDPAYYDPLPIGDSIYAKDDEIANAQRDSWAVFERVNRGRRHQGIESQRLETVVAFKPERLLDYIEFERQSQTLGFDAALRFVAARRAKTKIEPGIHELEKAFDLSATEVLDLIGLNRRLAMAVRGGVAELHLERRLRAMDEVAHVQRGALEGPPDFIATLRDGRQIAVECKNASPNVYADGAFKVETQKTRASKGDPLSRFYDASQFDVLAVCLFGPTGSWDFRFRRSDQLATQEAAPAKFRPLQRVEPDWAPNLLDALDL